MDFGTSIKTCFSKYVDFSGKASRSEFWWFFLFCLILDLVLSCTGFGAILSLVLLLPQLAVGARRLHDIGKSGWWQLIALIPVIGIIVLIIWWAKK